MSEKENGVTPILYLVKQHSDLRNLATSENIQLIEQCLKGIKQLDYILLIQELLTLLIEVNQYNIENEEVYGKIIMVHFEILFAMLNKEWRDLYKCVINGYCSSDNTTYFKRLVTFLELITDTFREIHNLASTSEIFRSPVDYSTNALKYTYEHNRNFLISQIILEIKKNKLVFNVVERFEKKCDFFLDLDRVYKDNLFSKEEFKKFVLNYYSLEDRPKLFKKYRIH